MKLRALLMAWVKWKRCIEITAEYKSPPNLIYRLMVGDVAGGGGFGSCEPIGLVSRRPNNPIFHRLDCVINELPENERKVIYCEFFVSGSQESKLSLLDIKRGAYQYRLNCALKQITNDDFIANLINTD